MNVAQYVASWVATVNPRVYGVCGAGAMHLNDAICNHPGITFTAMHHEQAATFAAETDSWVSGKPGIVHVTAGPGGTNTVTGLACAYVDSIPLIVIAGQVTRSTLTEGPRQLGVSELPMIDIVGPVTKYAVTVMEPATIRHCLDFAYAHAMSGRPGPVFIEIPLDIQNAEIDPANFPPMERRTCVSLRPQFSAHVPDVVRMLNQAERPVLIIGNGIRLSGGIEELKELVDALQIPVISGWSGSDILDNSHPCYIGRCGLHGDRASNFAVQNADLILAIGTRLSIPQIGHTPALFAPHAKKIVVDIDHAECSKETLKADLPICADGKEFIAALLPHCADVRLSRTVHGTWPRTNRWLGQCRHWMVRYRVMLPEYRDEKNGVNSYAFIEELTKHLDDDAIVVTDVGFAFVGTMQAMKLNGRQRLMHSSGVAPMGWGLPAAIGAYRAGGGRQVVAICGDGGIMFNLQELQTIAYHELPIAIFVLENGAYKTMQITQGNHFAREAASSEKSGVSCPNFFDVAQAFDLTAKTYDRHNQLGQWIERTLCELPDEYRHRLGIVRLDPDQQLAPRVQTKTENGKFIPTDIADMWPYLDREEYARNMSVGAVKREDAA